MQLAHALVALAALASSAAADASILFCNQDNCAGSCSTQTVPGDGACRELGGIESAQTQSLDPGCSGKSKPPNEKRHGSMESGGLGLTEMMLC